MKRKDLINTYPYCIPLTAFSEQGVYLLTSNEREIFGFVYNSCGIQIFVNFEKIVNFEILKYIRKNERLPCELDRFKDLKCWNEILILKEQARIVSDTFMWKKRVQMTNTTDLRSFVKKSKKLSLLKEQTRIAGQKLIL